MSFLGKRHSKLTGKNVGAITRWEVADEAARLALSLSESDNDSVCKQADGPTYWVLVDYAGPTWKQIDVQGGTVALEFQNDGTPLTASVASINAGNGLTASVVGDDVTLEVSGAVTSVTTDTQVSATGDITIGAADVGLENVDNTSDTQKTQAGPIKTALDGKAAANHTHVAFDDTRSGFVPQSPGGSDDYLRADGTWAQPPGSGFSGAHSALTGLAVGDDHPQYHTNARGDARYYLKSEVDAAVSAVTVSVEDDGVEQVAQVSTINFTGAASASVDGTDPNQINVNVAPGSAPINTVFTRTGDVVSAASDYDASQIDNDSDNTFGNVAGAFVDSALDTADAAIEANTTAAAAAQAAANAAQDDATSAKTKTDKITIANAIDLDAQKSATTLNTAKRSYPVADEAMVDDHETTLANVATPITTAGAALLDDADASAQRTTLQLGSAAQLDADNTIGNLPLLENVGGGPGFAAGIDGSNLENIPSGVTTFVALTDVDEPDYVGHAGQFVKVNATSDGLVFEAITGGGDMLSTNNLSDVANALTATQNLGVEVGVDVAAQGHTHLTLADVAGGTGGTDGRILGRVTAGAGLSEELTQAQVLSFLGGVEAGATTDQTAGEIKTAYESNADTNAYTDAEQTAVGLLGTASTKDFGNQAAGDLPELTAEGTLPITDGVSTTTIYSDGVRSQGAAVGVVAADGPPGSANYSGLYSDSVEVRNTTNQTAGLYVGDVSNIPSMDLVGATYTRTDTVGGIATNSPTFNIKGRDLVADRVIIDANQTHATGPGSDHTDVASNTAVRLTTDQYQAVTGADTPSASNVFLTEGDVGVAELSALMTDGPIAAFRIFADDTALQAAQGIANQYGWRQSDKTLWRDSGPAGAWEQVGASGVETNDLETACAGIAANEIVIGASLGIASYTPIASLTDEPSPTTGDKLLIQTTEGLRSLDVSNLPAGSETNNLESVCTGIAINEVPVGSDAGIATYTATTGSGFVVRSGSPTLTTPDIGTPTISSFASAGHNHSDAASGGQISYSNLTGTPNLPTFTKSITIEDPGTGSPFHMWVVPEAVTITGISYFCKGTTPSIPFNVAHGTNPTSLTNIDSAGWTATTTETTTIVTDTTFSGGTTSVAGGSTVAVVQNGAVTGTNPVLHVTVWYTVN